MAVVLVVAVLLVAVVLLVLLLVFVLILNVRVVLVLAVPMAVRAAMQGQLKGVHPAQRLATSAAICSQVHQAPLDTCILESSARAPMIRNCTDVVKQELDDICNILRQGCSETCPAKECAALLHRLGNEAEPGKRE